MIDKSNNELIRVLMTGIVKSVRCYRFSGVCKSLFFNCCIELVALSQIISGLCQKMKVVQRHIHNSVENSEWFPAVTYFCKKLHRRCLTGF